MKLTPMPAVAMGDDAWARLEGLAEGGNWRRWFVVTDQGAAAAFIGHLRPFGWQTRVFPVGHGGRLIELVRDAAQAPGKKARAGTRSQKRRAPIRAVEPARAPPRLRVFSVTGSSGAV